MELIYVYIDKYRGFAKQGINMSGRFEAAYNDIDNSLTVKKSAEYAEIYPKHIKGISAVVGKNATGKTSFLELIGKRIGDRNLCNEISVADKSEKWWEKSDDFVTDFDAESINHVASYFLLYYVGIVDYEEIYVFETDDLNKYRTLFCNKEDDSPDILDREYCDEKGWFHCVCTLNEGKLKFTDYMIESIDSPQLNKNKDNPNHTVLLLYNKNNKGRDVDFDYEEVPSVKRVKVYSVGNYIYDQMKFLHSQMNLETAELYKDETYTFVISYLSTSWITIDEKFVKKFTNFALDTMAEWQIAILNLLYNWCINTYVRILNEIGDNNKGILLECNVTDVDTKKCTYEQAKQYYLEMMNQYCKLIKNLCSYDKKCDDVIDIVERFLTNASKNGIHLQFQCNGFKIIIDKNTQIEYCKELCADIIDDDKYAMREVNVTLLDGLLSHAIEYLSEGEMSNLVLFLSINKHICEVNKDVNSFILLIDEIEENMHPEMCRRLVSDLVKFLKQYEGKTFQIIFSSHSPFVVSDLQNSDVICFSRNDEGELKAAQLEGLSFGQNIHTILKNGFFLDYTIGEFARNKIKYVSDKLDKQIELERNLSTQEYNDIKGIIDLIGERIVQNILNQKLSLVAPKQLKIEELKKQLESLEHEVGDLDD